MKQELITIYAAANITQANLLKNRLDEKGFHAQLTNETLFGGAGSELPGWNTLPRVMVPRQYAVAARKIAMEYDRQGATTVESQFDDPVHEKEMSQPWPRCPKCDAPRIAVCPICHSTGTFFPESDPDYIWGFGLEEKGQTEGEPTGHSCSCNGGDCKTGTPGQPNNLPEEGPNKSEDDNDSHNDADAHLVLICPMCDEPFTPQFPKECAWCDHQFEDGVDIPNPEYFPPEEIGWRVGLIGFGMVGLLAGVFFYFYTLVR
jgi:Putative prokaryotic signal transducing protein